ncbi:unnamed protein product, partial [Iphiclides podalirius]
MRCARRARDCGPLLLVTRAGGGNCAPCTIAARAVPARRPRALITAVGGAHHAPPATSTLPSGLSPAEDLQEPAAGTCENRAATILDDRKASKVVVLVAGPSKLDSSPRLLWLYSFEQVDHLVLETKMILFWELGEEIKFYLLTH